MSPSIDDVLRYAHGNPIKRYGDLDVTMSRNQMAQPDGASRCIERIIA